MEWDSRVAWEGVKMSNTLDDFRYTPEEMEFVMLVGLHVFQGKSCEDAVQAARKEMRKMETEWEGNSGLLGLAGWRKL